MTINSILEEIINLAKKYFASTVILFGSRAKGTATERSDIDIAYPVFQIQKIYGKSLIIYPLYTQ